MREIHVSEVEQAVCDLFQQANRVLPQDLTDCIACACEQETDELPRAIMGDIYDNLAAAKRLHVPICQDTGMAVLFCDLGQDVHLVGGDFTDAVNRGVRRAYKDGYLRLSVVGDPLRRVNTGDNTPAIIHLRLVPGEQIALTAAPKGFGSENMSALRMFTPSATVDEIEDWIIGAVRTAGSNPCPPMVLGVGIGGDFESCALLAKRALCRSVSVRSADPFYREMEDRLLQKVNALDVGPQGFGGKTTALSVAIETAPTHIAGLPVGLNVGCHVTRHAHAVL